MSKQVSRYEHVLGANHTQYDRSMRNSGRATKKLSDEQRSLAASVALIDGPLGGVASRVSNFNTLATKGGLAVGGFALAITGVGFAAAKSVKELSAYEVAQQRINNLLEQTGFASGRTAAQIEALAQTEGFRTLADVGDVRQAAAVLTSYKTVIGDVFDRAIALSNDAAQVFGGTVTSNVKIFAKALDNPIEGIERLERRYGELDASIKNQIESLAEQGRLFEAQDLLISNLEERLKGAGDGKGIAFSWDSLTQSMGNFFVAAGAATGASNGLTSLLDSAKDLFDFLTEELTPSVKDFEQKIERLEQRRGGGGGALSRARAELEALKQQNRLEKEKADEVERSAKAKAKEAIETKRVKDEWDALAAIFAEIDEDDKEAAKKRAKEEEKAAKKTAKVRKREEDAFLRLVESNEAEIERIRIRSLEPIERINAEHQQTLDRLDEIKKKTPGLAADVDKVIPIASARNVKNQEAAFERLLKQELNAVDSLDTVDLDGQDAVDKLNERYMARKEIIQSFAEDEINATKAKNDALESLDKKHKNKLEEIDKFRWAKTESAMMGALGNLSSLMNSHSKTMFNIGKVAAIAETVINTYKSATGAYAALAPIPVIGPALGAAAAAAAIAAGVANVQQIKSRTFGDRSAPSIAGGGAISTTGSISSLPDAANTENSNQGPTIVLNGNYNGDPEVLAEAIKGVIDESDFVLVDSNSRNGQDLISSQQELAA